MKNLQKGFIVPVLLVIIALLVIGGGVYVYKNKKVEVPAVVDNGAQQTNTQTPPVSAQQNTVTNPSNNQSVFVGTKKTFLPEKIISIDTSKKTFVVNYESRQAPFTIPTEFSVVSETTIKKENGLLNFNNLAVNDVVWIRAYEKGKDKYVAKNIIITNDWRSSQVIIKKIETNKITAEVFLPPQRRGEQTILTIIPETEIRKGKAEEGENRKVVGLSNLAIGDIASVVEVGFGVHPADDKGPFYTTVIDGVSPDYCEQYLKPTGCIEKDQSVNPTQTKTYTSAQYGFSIQYPTGTQITDTDISGGRNIIFTTSQGTVMVGVVTQAWHNGVLSSPPNCDDTASGADRTNTNINGVNFLTFSMSKEMSGMNSPTSATEYCAIQNGTAYKLITRVGYTQGSSNGLGLDKNPTLNQMVASFKLN